MKVGIRTGDLEAYLRELDELLGDAHTAVYLDASFLIESVRLGPKAMGELIEFFRARVGDRLHVPIWAAHEFHQHLVKGTAGAQTSSAVAELEGFGRRVYKELAPALSEAAAEPLQTADQHRLVVRGALQDLSEAARVLRSWAKENGPRSEALLVQFVNEKTLQSRTIFDYLPSIGELSRNRFQGRVPPGFQDKGKEAGRSDGQEGGNAAGDLMFWKEVLDHVKSTNRWYYRAYHHIVVITNDGKNDWVSGGGKGATPKSDAFKDATTEWGVLPTPHPMLEFEAKSYCGVTRLALANSHTLGALLELRREAPTYVLSSFQIGLPKASSRSPVGRAPSALPPAAPPAGETRVPPTQPPAPQDSQRPTEEREMLTALRRGAPTDSTAAVELSKQLRTIGSGETDKSVNDVMAESKCSLAELANFMASLMKEADSGDGAAQNVLQSILKALNSLPDQLASWMYGGILFGKYVKDGQVILRPNPLLLEDIVVFESAPFAIPGLELIGQLLEAEDRRPLYVPSRLSTKLPVNAVRQSVRGQPVTISKLLVGSVDVLEREAPAEGAEFWQLLAKPAASETKLDVQELAALIARYYGIPLSRLHVGPAGDKFAFNAAAGLRAAEEIQMGE